jgi:hypothetical protein
MTRGSGSELALGTPAASVAGDARSASTETVRLPLIGAGSSTLAVLRATAGRRG